MIEIPRMKLDLKGRAEASKLVEEVMGDPEQAAWAIVGLRNERDSLLTASRHRFTASEVESCMDDATREIDNQYVAVNFQRMAECLNAMMQNEEDYKDAMAAIQKAKAQP